MPLRPMLKQTKDKLNYLAESVWYATEKALPSKWHLHTEEVQPSAVDIEYKKLLSQVSTPSLGLPTDSRDKIEKELKELAEQRVNSRKEDAIEIKTGAVYDYKPAVPEEINSTGLLSAQTADYQDLKVKAFKKAEATTARGVNALYASLKGKRGSAATSKISHINMDDYLAQNRLELADTLILPPVRSETQKIDIEVRGWWEENPNADSLIQKAARVPIVHNQIRTIVEYLITSKPKIQGKQEYVDIVDKWFNLEIPLQTGYQKGMDRFVADVAKQMLYYGSCLVQKQRSRSEQVKKSLDPITGGEVDNLWGYNIPDMSTVEVFIDKQGIPRRWRQKLYIDTILQKKEYVDRDVIVARIPTANSSLYFWTPSYVMPALYAVQVLQDLHEEIESHAKTILNYRYYIKVGDQNWNNGAVDRESLDVIKYGFDATAVTNAPVVPWYVNVEKLELDEYIDKLKTVAEFWEQEIRRGVGGSMLQDGVGDSATRNTSDALTEKEMRAAQALVPEIQRVFSWLVLDKLWEAGVKVDDIEKPEDLPSIVFEEIDRHQQIRRETHANTLWQNNVIKHGEMRNLIGRQIDPEMQDKYFTELEAEFAPEPTSTGMTGQAKRNQSASQTKPGGTPAPKRKNS